MFCVGCMLFSVVVLNVMVVNVVVYDDVMVLLWFIFIFLVVGSAARTVFYGMLVLYMVVLFIIGMVMVVVYYYVDLGLLEVLLSVWGGINLYVLLVCFLFALIFELLFLMEWYMLKKVLFKVLILVGFGVLMSMVFIGCVLCVFLFDFSWVFCMMVGLILVVIDFVVVVVILKEVGVSKVLGYLIEGELFVNDGIVIVVFNVFLVIVKGEYFLFGDVMKDLII